jgi:hypothetical protein
MEKMPLGPVGSKSRHFNLLLAVQIVENIRLGQVLRAIKTLPALAATIGAVGQEKHDPKFQDAPAFGSMHVVTTTMRAISIFRVNEEAKFALH